ncbi:MAG: hypothetical protein PHS66_04955 [Candidatus Omnitrophica bacterium]|nr:hypothetical protein [Candidatus Omnitrophota bacterium]
MIFIVTLLVAFSVEYQRNDFDTMVHLVGASKIAISPKVFVSNPFLGPQYSYLLNYTVNPWYLAFGLTARMANINVAWLYVLLAIIFTPLFFFSVYALLKNLFFDNFIALAGALLMIGPWVSKMALGWGPGMGGFYLQFLPHPGITGELILLPIFLGICFNYLRTDSVSSWGAAILLALAAMGLHPLFLVIMPLIVGTIFFFSLFFPQIKGRKMIFFLFLAIFSLAAAIAYITVNPIHQNWIGQGYGDYCAAQSPSQMNHFLTMCLKLNKNLFAMHPKYFMHYVGFGGLASFVVILIFLLKNTGLPVNKKRYFIWVFAGIFFGPCFIVFNPLIVPYLVKLLNSPIPIWYLGLSYEAFITACKFGAIAAIVVILIKNKRFVLNREKSEKILLSLILVFGIGWSLGRPSVVKLIYGFINRDRCFNISILDASKNKLYIELSNLKQGVVAMPFEQAEYLAMTTPHYIIAASRMAIERRLDNEKLLNFSVSLKEMESLIKKYKCKYIVVSLDDNLVVNNEFSHSSAYWDIVAPTKAGVVKGGVSSGNCFELSVKKPKHNTALVYQDIICEIGQNYRLKGYVKSGTPAKKPFSIQIYQSQLGGAKPQLSIDGISSNAWKEFSAVFMADYRNLCVALRANVDRGEGVLFDSISVSRVVPDGLGGFKDSQIVEKFREQAYLFKEVITTDKYAVFEVEDNKI